MHFVLIWKICIRFLKIRGFFMIHIDGSIGESGGQIVRTALTLASITGKEVSIDNIRAGRPKPGLAAQHLTAVKAVRNVCRGTLEGAELGGSQLIFHPGEIVGGKYEFNIGTAGSVTLVAQTLIPILLQAKKESTIRIIGGTHVMKSPGYDYFEKVFIPAIREMGGKLETEILKPGYYPKGGGEIELQIKPSKLHGITEWQRTDRIEAIIRNTNLPLSIAMREKKVFLNNKIEEVYIRETQNRELGTGNAITAWSGFRGAYSLGKIGKRAEAVAQEAVDEIKAEKFDVDKHLADQLLIYSVLADGITSFETSEITNHLKTNAEIIQKFIEREIKIEENQVTIS
jgi:RNA 3'-terminal phosphate cyclase (ATP)